MTIDINKNPMGLSRGMEWAMVITLCLTFGFVMYDRFCITNMASFVMTDLNIDAGQLGLISSAFAIAWGFAGYFGGMAADMSKHKKKLLTIIVLLFSILSMSTGFTQGVASVACVRVLMGIVEGPVLPLCQSHVVHESTPARRGFNQGLVQVSAVGLFSSLLGPVLSVYLAQTIGWRGSFYVTIIPGLIICVMLIFLVKEPVIRNVNLADEFLTKNEDVEAVAAEQSSIDEPAAEKSSIKGAFAIVKDRNIILACIAAIFILTWYLNTLTFTQPFMVMDRGFDPTPVSIIMTCLGVGAIFWGAVLPKISDKIGRRYALCIGAVLAVLANLGIMYVPAGSWGIACVMAIIGWAGASVSGMFQGTVPTESVDRRYSTTACGIVQLVGELVGGGIMGAVFGQIINASGYYTAYWMMIVSILIVIPLALALRETAPAVVQRKLAKQAQA